MTNSQIHVQLQQDCLSNQPTTVNWQADWGKGDEKLETTAGK